ncbi:unnamed protein product, partial [Thelazia callipaeda]|uniref:Ryanodine receptor 3 n=1 Tax=Thelazia callipaeda TaxID=103827 RepID=A0A0N5CWB6_THECL
EGITTLSNVVESGLGLPAPEDLARSLPKEISGDDFIKENDEKNSSSVQSYRKLFTGFGANVVTSSLDVLEALGKKTFEKLTVKEQGSHKRRFIFEPERGQNLSQVLRELRESQEEKFVDDGSCMVKRESTFIEFFEKFGGMFHLEGLEMLSKNHLKKITIDKRREVDKIFANDLVNTLEEYQENDTEDFIQQLKGILLTTALPYNVKLGSVLIDSYKRFKERSENLPVTGDEIFVLFLECLADFTAQSVHSVHKMGQLLLITETKGNLEAFSHFLALVGRQISFFSNYFAQYISTADNSFEEIDELVTTVFLAAGDAFSYVQQSFRLLRPLLVV